jgi:release factor glutamine methyltransferase
MTIRQAITSFPKIETEIILGHILKKPREFLYTHGEKKLTPTQEKLFKQLAKRRTDGEPIAYLVGYKYFYGLKFKVTKDSLIPRPETEWIIEYILNKPLQESSILDIGTGSGCIAVTLKKHLPKSRITAVDISKKALRVAKQNAQSHKTKVTFIESDLFFKVTGTFDIIIANLPYVPAKDYKKFFTDLKYEPKNALTDGTNTFEIYKRFLQQVSSHTTPGTIILFEIDPLAKNILPKYVKQFLPTAKITYS